MDVFYDDDNDHLVNEESDAPENEVDDGSPPTKKRRGRIPIRVVKAEREKLKRDQLNELFNKLGSFLELSEQNNGKACILNETIRHLKDMVSQIRSLRNENLTLLSESQYVTTENHELKDENVTLEDQIKRVKTELQEKLGQSKPDLNITSREPPILGPLYVVPMTPNVQAASQPPAAVRKPQPRYPTPADSWPLHLLSKQPEMTTESSAS